jgi:hypothetical protein
MTRYKVNKIIVAGLMAQVLAIAVYGQSVSNKPNTQTQVPGPTTTVATPPGSYIVNSQSPLVNYVRERDGMGRIVDTNQFATAGYGDVRQTTHFFDGLGRPLQTVQQQLSPGNSPVDIVAPVVYDIYGREVYKYLPYAAQTGNTTDGNFKQDPFTDQGNFYQNIYPSQQPAYTGEQVYYGQTIYEASPLNRILQTMAPGNSWTGSGVGVQMQYLTSAADDSVVIWNITSDTLTYVDNDLATNIPTSAGYYAAGLLYKNVTIDESNHAVVEYKDKDGLVILKKVQIGGVPGDYSGYSGWLSTYYVYDNLNQLRFVLSPKATGIAYTNSWNLNADTTTLNELCFRYGYDYRLRMLGKKVPGAAWVFMVYDARDRLIYTQDANMRLNNQWMTTLYDGLNRPTSTGMITYAGTQSQLQAYVTANTGTSTVTQVPVGGTTTGSLPPSLDLTDSTENGDNQATYLITLDNGFETPNVVNFTAEIVAGGSTGTSFTDSVVVVANPLPPTPNFIGLIMTFYDDYSNTPDKQYTTTYNSLIDAGTNQHAETLPSIQIQQEVQTIGLVTGTKVRAIENPANLNLGNWMESATFYDDRARVIQTQADNYKGGEDTLTNLYNFTNQVITSYLAHANPQAINNNNTRIKTNYDLDFANRLTQVYKTINDQDSTNRLIAQHTYDQIGQLQQKQLGQLMNGNSTNGFLETQNYAYNIRGWLKGINRDYANNDNSRGADNGWFGLDLSYDWGYGTNFLNGNIAGEKWRSKGNGQQRSYGFGYDDANRILFADFNQYSGSGWDKSAGIDFTSIMGNGTDPTTAYDPNGNIQFMYQKGWQIGGSNGIDSLTYTYFNNSNKLQNVIDGDNNPQTTLGDFRTSALSPYYPTKTTAAVDYGYDANGNLLKDLNKDIGTQTTNGIVYNHLNLPYQVTVRSATGTKGTITYIYDAAGTKLKKTTIDSVGSLETVTTYIGAFQYQGTEALGNALTPVDTLKFFGHEEGRVRLATDTAGGQNIASFKYDYFLKDHLGDTRVVLTDEQEVDMYPMATMEVGDSSLENLYYSNLDQTRVPLPAGYPTDTTTNPNNYVAELQGAGSQPVIGPGITLKVMSGDQFSVRVTSWYQLNGATPGTPVNPLTDVLSALINGLSSIPGEHVSAAALQANSTPLSSNVLQFLSDTGSTIVQTKPHAFLNWMLFDDQFNYVASSSGFQQVGASGVLTPIIETNLPITSSGYLYIYVSNETPNIPVFFDNLQVTQTRGPLLEEDHYYPGGLTMAGISDQAIKANYAENKYRFQKQELQHKEFSDGSGLEMYEFKYRFDDCQIGRFWSVDPLASKYEYNSPYAFSEDKVTSHVELEGLEAAYINSKAEGEAAGIFQYAADKVQSWFGGFSLFNKTSSSTVVAQTPVSTTSAGTTVTTTVTPNFSNFMSTLTSTNHATSDQMVKTDVKVTADTKTEITTPVGTVTNKTSVNTSNGVVTNETGGKVKGTIDGVPITTSASTSASTDHQTTVNAQVSSGTSNGQVMVQGQYSTKGSQQSVSVGGGGQVTAGKTTVSTIFGIKFSW